MAAPNQALPQARVEAALAAGLTLFDVADIYGVDSPQGFGGCERMLGDVLANQPGLRQQFCLATKGGIVPRQPYDSRARYIIEACEASLERLQVDQIDLYQIHRPDLLAHPSEVAEALDALRSAGKIREAGVSNYTPAQVQALQAHLPFPLVSIQPEFSLFATGALDDGVLDQAMELGLAVLAWSPLGGGHLMRPGHAVHEVLTDLARRYETTLAAIAYAWILAHPARPMPLVGSQQVNRIQEAPAALSVKLTRSEWYSLLVAARGRSMPVSRLALRRRRTPGRCGPSYSLRFDRL